MDQSLPKLDEESLQHFAVKGLQDSRPLAQTGNANAVKVRRVLQLISDFAPRPIGELRVLDLACGEGVYSIEIGLRGAEVLGVDARTERMNVGIECARKNNLSNVVFRQDDVRKMSTETDGQFDVILFLGILYHLDVPDSFHVLTNLYEMCRGMLIVDTHIALAGQEYAAFNGRDYIGKRGREHNEADTPQERQKQLLQSIDNTWSFWFTRDSLTQLLAAVGFTTVLECFVPLEPHKPRNRVTLVAFKGEPVQVASYPWLNSLSEEEVAERLRPSSKRRPKRNVKRLLQNTANAALWPLGLELQRRSG